MTFVLKVHLIEYEELSFGTEVDGIGDARELEVTFGASSDAARVEPVTFFGNWINHIRDETQRLLTHEGIDPITRRIGHQQHVGFVDRGPASQRRSVESEAVFKRILAQLLNRKGQVMPGSDQVCETYVDISRLFILGKLQHIFNAHVNLLLF